MSRPFRSRTCPPLCLLPSSFSLRIPPGFARVRIIMAFRVSALRLPSHPLYYTFSLSLSVSLRLSHPPFRGRKYSYRDDESVCGEIQTVSIVIFGKFVGSPVPDIFFNRVGDQRRGGSVFYFEFVCTHFRNVRILFHDRTVLSQQANNISSSFSKCSLCQKVLRFTRTAHKGGFTSIKKLKRRLLEPCPSSSVPPALCKGRARYIFLPFYFFPSLLSILLSLLPSLDSCVSCFAHPVANLQISYIPNS